jgi:hypothetical protein
MDFSRPLVSHDSSWHFEPTKHLLERIEFACLIETQKHFVNERATTPYSTNQLYGSEKNRTTKALLALHSGSLSTYVD